MSDELPKQPDESVEIINPEKDDRFKGIVDLVEQRTEELGFDFVPINQMGLLNSDENLMSNTRASNQLEINKHKIVSEEHLLSYFASCLLLNQTKPSEFRSSQGVERSSLRNGFEIETYIAAQSDPITGLELSEQRNVLGRELNANILTYLAREIIKTQYPYNDKIQSNKSANYYLAKRFCQALGEDRALTVIFGNAQDFLTFIKDFNEISELKPEKTGEIIFYTFLNEVTKISDDDMEKAREIAKRYFGPEGKI